MNARLDRSGTGRPLVAATRQSSTLPPSNSSHEGLRDSGPLRHSAAHQGPRWDLPQSVTPGASNQGGDAMGKNQDAKKETKKPATKSLKEKRAEKQSKKK